MKGMILKSIGGFFYVKSSDGLYTCKARGAFRKSGMTPLAGDQVEFSHREDDEGIIEEILSRKNFLIRPPVANLDQLFIVSSTQDPSPNTLIIDKTIAIAENKGIEPVLVITKTDIGCYEELFRTYTLAGIPAIRVSTVSGEGIDKIRAMLSGHVSAFTGNSGVGKSSLLNAVFPDLSLTTGEISKKLGRGRHTTRHVELFPTEEGGYVADTPGFSTMDVERYELNDKEKLVRGFREFSPYLADCRFSSCSHTCEKGCAVIAAVEDGKISRSRYDNYKFLFDEVKDIRQWKTQKNV